jgi:ADP-ribosylglycohydrolase
MIREKYFLGAIAGDTIACIIGGIAEAYYKEVPEYIANFVSVLLGPDLMKDVIIPFSKKYRK